MTARERRLERRLCERERELIEAQLSSAWYFERWCAAAGSVVGLARAVDDLLRCKRDVARRARAAA